MPPATQPVELNFYETAVDQNLPGVTDAVAKSTDAGFGVYLGIVIGGVMVIAALMVFLYLIWAGIDWITAGGDQSKIGKARDKITQSIIGIIVLAASFAIFGLVQDFLGLSILKWEVPASVTRSTRTNSTLPSTAAEKRAREIEQETQGKTLSPLERLLGIGTRVKE